MMLRLLETSLLVADWLDVGGRLEGDAYAAVRWARLRRWKRSKRAKAIRAERAERERLKRNAMEAFKAAKRLAENADHERKIEEGKVARAAKAARQNRWEGFQNRVGYLQHVFELEEDKRARRARTKADAPVIEQRPYEHAKAMRSGEELHAAWLRGQTNVPLVRGGAGSVYDRMANKPSPLRMPTAIQQYAVVPPGAEIDLSALQNYAGKYDVPGVENHCDDCSLTLLCERHR